MAMNFSTLAVFFPLLLLLTGLTFTVIIDPYIQREHRRTMLIIIVLCIVLTGQNLLENAMTQIQPHFLFNALNTIRALYAKDPPLGDRTLENFSTYLRQNLESLSQSDLVPVDSGCIMV